MSTLDQVVDALQQTPLLEECHNCEDDCSGCHDNGPGGNEEGNGTGLVADLFNTNDIVVEGCTVTSKRFHMTQKQQALALNTLMEYPLPHVEWRLLKEERVPVDQVPEAMLEWRRFMATILFADGSVGMISPVVDEVWHAHILFTKEYAQFCQTVFGQFIGHAPNWPGVDGTKPLHNDNGGVRRFLSAYQDLFGALPAIWGVKRQGQCEESKCDCQPSNKAHLCIEGTEEEECTDGNGCSTLMRDPEPAPLCVGPHCLGQDHCGGKKAEYHVQVTEHVCETYPRCTDVECQNNCNTGAVMVTTVCENYSCGDCIDE